MWSLLNQFRSPAKRRSQAALRPLQPLESRLLLSGGHAAGPHTAAPSDFSGQWEINIVPTFVLDVNQSGGHVTATFSGNDFHFDLKGTVHGATMKLKGSGENPNGPTKYTLNVTLNSPTSFEGTETFKSHKIPKEPLGVVGDHL